MIALSLLLAAGAIAALRGALAIAAPLSILALAATFITGFSIGVPYFPGRSSYVCRHSATSIREGIAPSNPPAA